MYTTRGNQRHVSRVGRLATLQHNAARKEEKRSQEDGRKEKTDKGVMKKEKLMKQIKSSPYRLRAIQNEENNGINVENSEDERGNTIDTSRNESEKENGGTGRLSEIEENQERGAEEEMEAATKTMENEEEQVTAEGERIKEFFRDDTESLSLSELSELLNITPTASTMEDDDDNDNGSDEDDDDDDDDDLEQEDESMSVTKETTASKGNKRKALKEEKKSRGKRKA